MENKMNIKNLEKPGSMLSDLHASGHSKSRMYKWAEIKRFGNFLMIDKRMLFTNHVYQRELNNTKATDIAKNFDFVCFNALTVAQLGDGTFEVLDGQHRLAGAMKRAEITTVPCIVYDLENIEERAKAFLDMQTLRKPVTAIEKFKAQVVSGDKVAIDCKLAIDSIGRYVDKSHGKKTNSAKVIGFIARLYKSMGVSPESAKTALVVANSLFETEHIPERIYIALFQIEEKLKKEQQSILDKKIISRIKSVGGHRILSNINRHCALFGTSAGENVMRRAAVEEINKGLRVKIFDFDSQD